MVSLRNIFLLSSTVFSAIALKKRATISTVHNDVKAIDTNVKSLITATQDYDGGILTTLPLVTDLTAVLSLSFKASQTPGSFHQRCRKQVRTYSLIT
jgi:hypothetical protein